MLADETWSRCQNPKANEAERAYDEVLRYSANRRYHTAIRSRILRTWALARDAIAPGAVVVEAGVGPMACMVRELTGAKVIGIDLGRHEERLCERFGIELRVCDLQCVPVPLDSESVDVLFLLEVIEHLCAYPEDVFSRLASVMKPGGILVLSTVNFVRISNRIRMALGRNPLINEFKRTPDGRFHIREFVPGEIVSYLSNSGFEVARVVRWGIVPQPYKLKEVLASMAYLYPGFRNYFVVVAVRPRASSVAV